MTAESLEARGPRDPGDDPAAIFELLPASHRAQFRADYDQALDAAHELDRFKQVRSLLRQWRLRAMAYARPGYEEAVQDALQGRSDAFARYSPPDWDGRVSLARTLRAVIYPRRIYPIFGLGRLRLCRLLRILRLRGWSCD